jgi:hypothetical protein
MTDVDVPRRETWPGYSVDLGEGFRVRKGPHEAVCWLRTHELGWELVLNVNGSLQRSEVCRSRDAVLDLTESWKVALVGHGWRDAAGT